MERNGNDLNGVGKGHGHCYTRVMVGSLKMGEAYNIASNGYYCFFGRSSNLNRRAGMSRRWTAQYGYEHKLTVTWCRTLFECTRTRKATGGRIHAEKGLVESSVLILRANRKGNAVSVA